MMAIARDDTPEHVKPLEGADVRRFLAGAAVEAGELLYQTSTAWEVGPADTTSAAVIAPVGIALQDAADGVWFDVVTAGPVVCVTGATPGANVYCSDTAGEPSESTGTKTTIMGYAVTTTIVFVQPQVVSFS